MALLSRRLAVKKMLGSALFGSVAAPRWRVPGFLAPAEISESELKAMQSVAGNFMKEFEVPGLSIAIAQNGKLAYNGTFGFANRERSEPVSTSSLLRIASVTKPITSVGIFSLVEKGKIRLMDRVFGAGAILGTDYGKQPYKRYIQDICVDHLLTHTCGGWPNDSSDPMFRFPEFSRGKLISWTLNNLPIINPPGDRFAYSNFGYCVLGRIIEKIAGMPYQDYIRHEILARCMIKDMRISGNTLKQRAPNEVVYYGQNGENPYEMNVARMDSHGGWLASAADLARFAGSIDETDQGPGLLSRDSVVIMTTPSTANSKSAEVKYARGWNVRNEGKGNWWHNGSLPGTAAILVRTSTGFCWAALINTRSQPANDINSALDKTVWDMTRQVSAWKV